jgi:hypothetical protein
MSRTMLCQAGNCHTELPASQMLLVRDTDGAQYRFCSHLHLIEWAISHFRRYRKPEPPTSEAIPLSEIRNDDGSVTRGYWLTIA